MSVVERYWLDDPQHFFEKASKVLSGHADAVEVFELCTTTEGIPVSGFRIGTVDESVFVLGGVHGHEPGGPSGLLALAEGLLSATVPGTQQAFDSAHSILSDFTVHVFPLLNPDAARRYASQVPESFMGNLRYCQEDSDRLVAVLHEPGLVLGKRRPPHFSAEEVAMLAKTGKPMGSLFTGDGVELWKDWAHDVAPQTRALKKLMKSSTPRLVVDVHGDAKVTTIYCPVDLQTEHVPVYKSLGRHVYDALSHAGLPFNQQRTVVPYQSTDEHQSVSWAYRNLGSIQFLYEVDCGYRVFNSSEPDPTLPTISKGQTIMSVWHGVIGLLSGFAESCRSQE